MGLQDLASDKQTKPFSAGAGPGRLWRFETIDSPFRHSRPIVGDLDYDKVIILMGFCPALDYDIAPLRHNRDCIVQDIKDGLLDMEAIQSQRRNLTVSESHIDMRRLGL